MKNSLCILLLAVAAAPAMANVILTNGDASFAIYETYVSGSQPYHPWTSATSGDADFKTDATALDQAYKYCWGVRQQYGTNHYMDWFSYPAPTRTVTANTVTYGYLNAGTSASGYFDATFVVTLVDGAVAGQAKVLCDVTIFNRDTTGSKIFNLFNDVNLDIGGGGSAANDTASIIDGNVRLGRISDPTLGFGDTYGPGAARYEVNTASNVGTHCFTGSYDLLTVAPNIPAPYGPADVAIGMQWTQEIAAQHTATFHHEMSLGIELPEPSSLGLLALAGMLGLRRRHA